MIYECDNRECIEWIKMADTIFEDMFIDLSKIPISISVTNNKYLEFANGKAISDEFGCFIYIRNDLQFDSFIQTYSHEIGHITQKFGIYENPNNSVLGVIAESIALKFEKEFLIKFNKKYDKNISVNAFFDGFDRFRFAHYGKNLVILITKSEYKLKK